MQIFYKVLENLVEEWIQGLQVRASVVSAESFPYTIQYLPPL